MKDNGIQIYRLSIEVKKRLLSYNEARSRYAQFTVSAMAAMSSFHGDSFAPFFIFGLEI
jgi:hypothetical protein